MDSEIEKILHGLNAEQYDGVTTTEGPVLILAGAGSGKTKVLTHRISYIIKTKNIGYENILAVTFTNKASKEMKERISRLLDVESNNSWGGILPFMGTFHSVCVKILRADGDSIGISPNFAIYDTNDQQDVIKEILKNMNISTKDVSASAVNSAISSAKNELKDPKEFERYAQGYFLQTVSKIYYEYEKAFQKNNAMDFDDIIMNTVKLFSSHPEVLEKYQNLFHYILVDEYQDTNHAQYNLVNQLSAKHKNICVVGDPDQSIYSFRGADISNILSFEKDYPDAKVIKLEQNYRSTKNILDAAQFVIEQNKNRKEKKLISNKGEGRKIIVYEAQNEMDESRFVANKINEFLNENYGKEKPLSNVAILYRTNAQSRGLEEQMIRSNLPYILVGGLRFYDRKEIKDLLSYLRIIYNPEDNSSLKRIINTPVRGIGPKAYSDLMECAEKNNMSAISLLQIIADLTPDDIKSIKEEDPALAKISSNMNIKAFADMVKIFFEKAIELHPSQLLDYILEKTDYINYIDDRTPEAESRKENIKELFSVADKYSELDPATALTEMLTEVSLVEQESKHDQDSSKGAVTLMTIHAAKGLEFEMVFIVGLEEGLFPHSRVFTDPHELEEERRLCYVAITRAKANLHLIYAAQRMIFGRISSNPASRFLADIPENLLAFSTSNNSSKYGKAKSNHSVAYSDFADEFSQKSYSNFSFGAKKNEVESKVEKSPDDFVQEEYLEVGDNVTHQLFGKGKILSADNSIITVRFDSAGVKKLAKEFAKLKKA
ncbi:MAG: UvrD-helicase domain-containing protein [bacterium]